MAGGGAASGPATSISPEFHPWGPILGGMTGHTGDDAFAKPRRPDIPAGTARFGSTLT